MHNHFRTLLLNLPYAGTASEHIPSSFNSISLPTVLQRVYNVLFPRNTSRFFRTFLVQNYIGLVKAANLEADILKFDSRITYKEQPEDYFKIYRHSNPVISNSSHPLFVRGKYIANTRNNYYYDNFLVSQVDDTSKIQIYSTINEYYFTPEGATTIYNTTDTEFTLDFGGGTTSEDILIGNTGISIAIAGGDTFEDTSDKTWQFLVEAPYQFDFLALYEALKSANAHKIFDYKPEVDTEKYRNLWNFHFNPVYKVAGLLLAYVTKIDSLL